MNSAERKVLHVALALFLVGILVRFLPWGLPSIDYVDIGDRPRRVESPPAQSKLDYVARDTSGAVETDADVTESLHKLAEKIIAFRELHGPFTGGASLQKVPGIGKKKLEGILQSVIFD